MLTEEYERRIELEEKNKLQFPEIFVKSPLPRKTRACITRSFLEEKHLEKSNKLLSGKKSRVILGESDSWARGCR